MPFGKLQALPPNAIPVSISKDEDIAFLSITKGIRVIVQELTTDIPVNVKSDKTSNISAEERLYNNNIKERYNMRSSDDPSKYTINNTGPVHGQIIGGQHGQVISGQNIYITEKRKDGVRALEMGAKALLNEDYSSANKELRIAIQEIDQEQQKREAAKARYLKTLAALGNESPREKGIVVTEEINRLLNAAIRLDQCDAYFMTIAVIRDPLLRKQANSTRITSYDEELFAYLKHCQPDLYHQIRQVFGI
jgi:hypothetical protein